MSLGLRIPYRTAYVAALRVVGAMLPAVEKIEIAGSLRRCKPDVGDIEIVTVPRLVDEPLGDLFGSTQRVSLLERRLGELHTAGTLTSHPKLPANGAKYKRLWLPRPGIQVDLFIVTAATWATALLIRTGPSEFSQRVVTKLHDHGLACRDLTIYRGQVAVPCPSEAAFLQMAGLEWVEPEKRR